MSDIENLMVAAAQEEPAEGQLARLRSLADQITTLENEIEAIEGALKLKNKRLFELTTKTLPEAMGEVGMKSFKLLDGNEVSVNKKYYAGITEENREAAFAWLRDNGHRDLIKNQFVVAFSAGQDQVAGELRTILADKQYNFDEKTAVHPGTLGTFVREQMEAEKEIPLGLLGAFVQDVAEIKAPKKAGSKSGKRSK